MTEDDSDGDNPKKEHVAEPTTRKAIVFVHGQGEHLPMAAARDLVESVFEPGKGEARYVPDTPGISSEASRIEVDQKNEEVEKNGEEGVSKSEILNHSTSAENGETPPAPSASLRETKDVDVFEFYWSHLKSGNRLSDVWLWFRRLIFISFDDTPEPIKPVRQTVIFFAEIAAIFLAAFAILTASVMFDTDLDVSYPEKIASSASLPGAESVASDEQDQNERDADADVANVEKPGSSDSLTTVGDEASDAQEQTENGATTTANQEIWDIQDRLYNLRTRFDIHPSDQTLERVGLRQFVIREPYLIKEVQSREDETVAFISKPFFDSFSRSTDSSVSVFAFLKDDKIKLKYMFRFTGVAIDAQTIDISGLEFPRTGLETDEESTQQKLDEALAISTREGKIELFPLGGSRDTGATINLRRICRNAGFGTEEYADRFEFQKDQLLIQGDEGFKAVVSLSDSPFSCMAYETNVPEGGTEEANVAEEDADEEVSGTEILETERSANASAPVDNGDSDFFREDRESGILKLILQNEIEGFGVTWGDQVSESDQTPNILQLEKLSSLVVLLRAEDEPGSRELKRRLELWRVEDTVVTEMVENFQALETEALTNEEPVTNINSSTYTEKRWVGSVTRVKNLTTPAFSNGDTRNALPISRVVPLIFTNPCPDPTDGFSVYYQSNAFDKGPDSAEQSSGPSMKSNPGAHKDGSIGEAAGPRVAAEQYLIEGGPQFNTNDDCQSYGTGRIYTRNQKVKLPLDELGTDDYSFVNMSATASKTVIDELSAQNLVIASVLEHKRQRENATEIELKNQFFLHLDAQQVTGIKLNEFGGIVKAGESFSDLRATTSFSCKLGSPGGDRVLGLSVSTHKETPTDQIRLAVATPLGVGLEQFSVMPTNDGIRFDPYRNRGSEPKTENHQALCKFSNWLVLPDGRRPFSTTISDDGQTIVVLDDNSELHLFDWPSPPAEVSLSGEDDRNSQPRSTQRGLQSEDSVAYNYNIFSTKSSLPERVTARWLNRLINFNSQAQILNSLKNKSALLKSCPANSGDICFQGAAIVNDGSPNPRPPKKCQRVGENGPFATKDCLNPKNDPSLHIVQFVSDDLLMVTLPGGVVLQEVSPGTSGKRRLGQAFWLASSNLRSVKEDAPEYGVVKAGVLLAPETSLVAHGGSYGPAYARPDVELIALQSTEDNPETPYEAVRFKVSDAAPYPTSIRGLIMFLTVISPFIIIATILAVIFNHWVAPARQKLLTNSLKHKPNPENSRQHNDAFPKPENRLKRTLPSLAESSIVFFGLLIGAVFALLLAIGIQSQKEWFIAGEDGAYWIERGAFIIMAVCCGAVVMMTIQLLVKIPIVYASVRRFVIVFDERQTWRRIAWAMTAVSVLLSFYAWTILGPWAFLFFAALLLAIWNPDLLKWFAQIGIYVAIPIVIVSLIFHSLDDPRYGSEIVVIYALFALGLIGLSLVWARRLIPAIVIGLLALPLTIGAIVGLGLQGLVGGVGVANVLTTDLDQLYAAILVFIIVSSVAMVVLAQFNPGHSIRGGILLLLLAFSLAFFVAQAPDFFHHVVYGLLILGPTIGAVLGSKHRRTNFRVVLTLGAFLFGTLLASLAFMLFRTAPSDLNAYELWLDNLLPLYPTWTIACLFIIAVLGGVAWIISRSFLVPIMADTARYLSERPKDVKLAREIREQGVHFINDLHTSKRYDEIIVVAHSLGSIIALDVLSQVWSRRNKLLSDKEGNKGNGATRNDIEQQYRKIDNATNKLQEAFVHLSNITRGHCKMDIPEKVSHGSEHDEFQRVTVAKSLDDFVSLFELLIREQVFLDDEHREKANDFIRRLRLEGPSYLGQFKLDPREFGLHKFLDKVQDADSDTAEGSKRKTDSAEFAIQLKKAKMAFYELQAADAILHSLLREPNETAANQPTWIISKFVTLGSPLTYGSYLLGKVRSAYYPKSTGLLDSPGRELEEETQVHLSDILPTQWTNIFFKTNRIVIGDIVGGPIWRHFGAGVTEIELTQEYPNGRMFAHNEYWKRVRRDEGDTIDETGRPDAQDRSAHLIELKKVISSLSK
ncbi:MAG: hypothetical protein Hens2KO_27780 [Henriciella sp.]